MAEAQQGIIYAVGSRDNEGDPIPDFFAAEIDAKTNAVKRIEYMKTVEGIKRLRKAVEALQALMDSTVEILDTDRHLQSSH